MTDASQKPEGSPKKRYDPAFPQEILDVTGEEVLEFFEHLDPHACCPVCKHDLNIMAAIRYSEDSTEKEYLRRPAIVGMPVHEYPEKGSIYKTPCFVISCLECGHLSYFMVNPLMKWKKSNDNKE